MLKKSAFLTFSEATFRNPLNFMMGTMFAFFLIAIIDDKEKKMTNSRKLPEVATAFRLFSRAAAAVSVLCVGAGSAVAAPLAYSEAVSGELRGDILTLDIGTNTVSGTQGWELPSFARFDFFNVIVQPGQQLTLVDFTLTADSNGPDAWSTLSFDFTDSSDTLDTFSVGDNPSDPFLAALTYPLAAGTYEMKSRTAGASGGGSMWDYTWTFEVEGVAPVPLPAGAWLFGSALVGAGVVGRRKKKQA